MGAAGGWRAGAASDTGLLRARNEDRYWVDEERGIFLVVDGVGGHAAGETAAEIAVETIREQLAEAEGPAEERVRRAITDANNRIFERAQDAEALRGMACVLTLAVVDDGQMVIGHVGDSRLYLIWNGGIRKLTPDHSPVGEGEDAGEFTEEQAMLHPRRNEVFRDVGTRPRDAGDGSFVEVRRCDFKPDAAFLLCTDGLSDLLPAAAIREIAERYAGEPEQVARELVEAANEAGGKDNVTAVLVAGGEFRGRGSGGTLEARARHATTRMRMGNSGESAAGAARSMWAGRAAFLIYGVVLGFLLCAALLATRG
ncbi:MAG TPA: protein phosphatase 2C domain-containing protein [Bryobacteraceae bacterium]|nr:protein phosphatase 2C domain-containing protein [Bryobacteraceae bacterium]